MRDGESLRVFSLLAVQECNQEHRANSCPYMGLFLRSPKTGKKFDLPNVVV